MHFWFCGQMSFLVRIIFPRLFRCLSPHSIFSLFRDIPIIFLDHWEWEISPGILYNFIELNVLQLTLHFLRPIPRRPSSTAEIPAHFPIGLRKFRFWCKISSHVFLSFELPTFLIKCIPLKRYSCFCLACFQTWSDFRGLFRKTT